MRRQAILIMLLVLVVAAAGLPAQAENDTTTTTSEIQELKAQLRKQQQKIQELEQLLGQQAGLLAILQQQQAETSPGTPPLKEISQRSAAPLDSQQPLAASKTPNPVKQEAAPKKEDEEAPILASWTKGHAFIKSADGNFTMQFGGRAQLDYRHYTGTATPESSFLIRRARFEAEGQLFPHFEYKVQADFADRKSTMLRDAFLNVNYTERFQVKFGHFKQPFSQEELQSSKYIDFVERSSVNKIVPGRSPGLMFHGQFVDGAVQYALGIFNGQGTLNTNSSSTPEVNARLRFSPFKKTDSELFKNFSFGGAVARGRQNGGNSFEGKTASGSLTFFSKVPVNGQRLRANGEFWWRYKNWSLRAEYDQTNQEREALGPAGTNLPGVVAKGYILQTTYLLTGETKTESGITPKAAFLADDGGVGAWELALRYENLQVHDRVNPNRAEAYTFGVNWWLTKFVRYQSNFILERFEDTSRAPTPGKRNHFAYLSRVQVIF